MKKLFFSMLLVLLCGSVLLAQTEESDGLKEALVQGITKGAEAASAIDGFNKNPLIRIPFPQDAKIVSEKLRQMGMGKKVDEFEVALNRSAEEASKSAKPIFVDAIKSLSFKDVLNILTGGQDAATQYLKTETSGKLITAFKPIVKTCLGKTSATKYYKDLVGHYNKIPMVKKVNPDLEDYATKKAIDGLFTLIAQEEKNIRENPVARGTALLQKVFGKKQ